MENILTENHEELDQSQVAAVNVPIDENWFIKEVRNFSPSNPTAAPILPI